MFLSPMQSRENLADLSELSLMKEDDSSLDYPVGWEERTKFVLQRYSEFESKINAIVNFPQQKEELLKEINALSIELLRENSIEDLSKTLEGFSNKLAELEAIDLQVIMYTQKFTDIKYEIDAEGLVVDAMADQYKKLETLIKRGFEKINGFNPLQKNEQGEYPAPYFIKMLDADLSVLKDDLSSFQHHNGVILIQREKDRDLLKEEVKSLKPKISPFLADSSGEMVSSQLDDLEVCINELDTRVEKNIKDAKDSLQKLKNILDKCTLSSFLSTSGNSISTIKGYKVKLNKAGKIAQAKANAFTSIIEKFDLIQDCANSPSDLLSAKEMIAKVQVLEDEIRNQKDTLAQYRGITFFRPLMRCLGKGEVSSLEYVTQLECAIKGFKSKI